MCLIGVPNLKEIHPIKCCFFLAQSIVANQCKEEEKYEENQAVFRNAYLKTYLPDILQI